MNVKIGILNISDRASKGVYEDIPGKTLVSLFEKHIQSPWNKEYAVVSDDLEEIQGKLIEFSDQKNCHCIFTTGGTGPAPRDNTPEATQAVCQKLMPGLPEQMRRMSVEKVPTAILSRQVVGIRNNKTLIINLPGRPRAISECMDVVFPVLKHCIRLVSDLEIEIIKK